MKKLHFSLMAILFALFSMVSFTACSSSDDDDTSASGDIKTNIVGTWELTHIKGWYWADDEDESHIIVDKSPESDDKFRFSSNPQPIGFSGILLAKRQNSFYCTYFLGITETS